MLYTTLTVKDYNYKCRLSAKACVDLEKKLGTNPLNIFVDMAGDTVKLPSLGTMLTILHCSLQQYEHGITMDKIYEIYDSYIAEGHTQMDLIPVLIDIYKVSGLIPEEIEEEKNV